jgi:hypothetical protein
VASGATNSWPFQYHGLEHEFTDPAQLYYSGGGEFYNPQIQRGLSGTNATGISGPPSGHGAVSASSPSRGQQRYNPEYPAQGALAGLLAGSAFGSESGATLGPIGAVVGGIIGGIVGLIEDLLSGPQQIEKPRKDQHLANDLDPMVTGANPDLTKNEAPSAPKLPCDGRPLAPDAGSFPGYNSPFFGFHYCGQGDLGGEPTNPTDACCQAHDCAYANAGLSGANVNVKYPGQGAGPAQRQADANLCNCVRAVLATNQGAYLRDIQMGIGDLFCYPQ